MKKSWLKRKTPLKAKTWLKRGKTPLKRSSIRIAGVSDTATDKKEIQRLLRLVGIARDGGCVFRDYIQSGACGGYRNDGELILQFDHLHSRVHAISFSDSRLGITTCKRHHIFWKPQYPAEYEKIAREVIGEERCKLLDMVREDRGAHKVDLKLSIIGLKKELKDLQ